MMARRTRVPRDQEPLQGTGGTRRRLGRTEMAVERAIREARKVEGMIEATDAAMVAVAKVAARAIDEAEADHAPYAVAQLTPRLLDVLRELGITPMYREATAHDALTELLAEISTPTPRDAGQS